MVLKNVGMTAARVEFARPFSALLILSVDVGRFGRDRTAPDRVSKHARRKTQCFEYRPIVPDFWVKIRRRTCDSTSE